MNPWLLQLINQGLIHGPKIPQYAQNVARGGEKVVRGGINTLNKYANPVLNKIFNTQMGVPIQQQTPSALGGIHKAITPAIASQYFDNPKQAITDAGYFSGADDASKLITGEGESGFWEDAASLIESIINSDSEDKKETKKETKKSDDGWNIDDLPLDAEEAKKKKKKKKKKKDKKDSKEAVKNLHKGGYVKKQRKRKPYKSSGFVKMKKSKKRKYI